MITAFYMVGVIVAAILGSILLFKEKNDKDLQPGMMACIALMSWISVILILWKYKEITNPITRYERNNV
jgi:hypothetical protein